METGKKEETRLPLPVVVTGYAFDDQALDSMIEMFFRAYERLLRDPKRLRKLLRRLNDQKFASNFED